MYLPQDINNLLAINEKTVFLTVVGVVHDIKLADLVAGNGEVGAYYFPMEQDASRLPDVRGHGRDRPVGDRQLGASAAHQQPRSRAAGLRDADDGPSGRTSR